MTTSSSHLPGKLQCLAHFLQTGTALDILNTCECVCMCVFVVLPPPVNFCK